MITCTIIQAAFLNKEYETSPISGIPEYHSKKKGEFHGKTPRLAASKALTSIYAHLKKYQDEWFPTVDLEHPPNIVFVIENVDTQKKYAYIGSRVTAPQSRNEPRRITNKDGRVRVYKWINKLESRRLADIIGE
jgi:hypothetical protein